MGKIMGYVYVEGNDGVERVKGWCRIERKELLVYFIK